MKNKAPSLALITALALLPIATAQAEENKKNIITMQLQTGFHMPCKEGKESRVTYIREEKSFAVCDGENWRKIQLGDVIEPQGTKEGKKQ